MAAQWFPRVLHLASVKYGRAHSVFSPMQHWDAKVPACPGSFLQHRAPAANGHQHRETIAKLQAACDRCCNTPM